jgi:hypothetical protein
MNLVKLIFSGVFQRALARTPTVQADIDIAIDKTIAALQAWKLVNQRIEPILIDLKNSEQ